MIHNSYIPIHEMTGRNTAEVAKLLKVAKGTLLRWLRDGVLPEPKQVSIAGVKWRKWSDADIARARNVKTKMRRGPKPKQHK
jgi:excisionase family DNA binding protein